MQVEDTNFEQDVVALNEHLFQHSPSVRRQFRLAWFGASASLLLGGFALIFWARRSATTALWHWAFA